MSRYADIVAKKFESETISECSEITEHTEERPLFQPKVWNPPMLSTSGNFVRWKTAYFTELLELRNIVAEKLSEKVPEMTEYFYSQRFFEKLSLFIRSQSSGRITG